MPPGCKATRVPESPLWGFLKTSWIRPRGHCSRVVPPARPCPAARPLAGSGVESSRLVTAEAPSYPRLPGHHRSAPRPACSPFFLPVSPFLCSRGQIPPSPGSLLGRVVTGLLTAGPSACSTSPPEMRPHSHPHLTDGKTEARTGSMPCPASEWQGRELTASPDKRMDPQPLWVTDTVSPLPARPCPGVRPRSQDGRH